MTTTDTTPEHLLDRQRAEQLRLLCAQLPFGMGISQALALVYVIVMWNSAPPRTLVIWWSVLATINLWRGTLYQRFRRLPAAAWDAVLVLRWPLRAGALLGGLLWGLTPWLFYPQGYLPLELFNMLVLAGVTSGAATSLAADRWSAAAFQLAVLLPLALLLLVKSAALHWPMAVSVLLYGVHAIFSTRRTSRQISDNIELRLDAKRRELHLHESESRYRQLAHYDALTGLLNRHALLERLTGVLGEAQGRGTKVALICLDIDHFKKVNDTYGHALGDQLLVEVARRLQNCVRSDDAVVRMGGDEFIVISTYAQDRECVAALAQRIKKAVNEPLALGSLAMRVEVSIGIGIYPDDGRSAELLMRYADIALYQAKASGRNDFRFFDVQMNEIVQKRAFLERALTEAVGTEQLFVEYQPLVDLPSRRVMGLEALLRWRHPERGLMLPTHFIPLAEQSGLINAIGEHVLREVCRQLKEWQSDLVPLVPVAVNVSSRQFEHGRVADLFIKVIEEFSLDPQLIQIEITETELMRNIEIHAQTLRRLREFGVKVSIDDFGTGYSSLSYLKKLPIDSLKIDRSFIGDMISDTRDAAIVRAMIGIAQSLKIVVAAEGVESTHQVEHLRTLGCDAAQGYFFYPPMAAEKCQPLLEQLGRQIPVSETLKLRLLRWAGAIGTKEA